MAVLSPDAVTPFPGADRVLAAHTAALPQPDQLCGPFAASLALRAVLDDPPATVDLARAAGTRIWPHDVPEWRPDGAPLDRSGWDDLPRADSEEDSGTDASSLVTGIASATGGSVTVVPVSADGATPDLLGRLLTHLASSREPVGVVANLLTGPVSGSGWDVGHFVVLWGAGPDAVGIADSYAELGAAGFPPGCRAVPTAALADAVSAGPGRGLLLLLPPDRAETTEVLVERLGLSRNLWST